MSEKNLLENILQNPLVKQYRRGALTKKIYLLQSEGGSGKTTALLSLYLYLVHRSLSDMSVVPLFVDVKKLTEFGEMAGSDQIGNMPRPIEKYIVKAYCCSDNDPKETMLEKVVHLFSPNNSPKFQKKYMYYLFLDGLNEVGFQAKQILWGEINSIAQADCVKIFVSSRTDEPNLPDGIAKLSLLPLKEEDIHAYLEHNFGRECTEKTDTRKINPSLVHILQIPMYLKVFRKTYNHKSPYPDIYEENIIRKADILDSYIQKLLNDNREKERQNDKTLFEFVVQYFLPAFAFQMVKNNASFIASDSDFKALRSNLQYFDSLAVPDEMLEAFQTNNFATKTACLNTGLLVFTDNQYTFAHQDWRDFFAAKHLINCMNADNDKLDDFEKAVDANIRRFTGELVREYSKTHKYSKAYDNKVDERKSECDFEQKEDLQAWGASPIEHFLQKHNLNSVQPLSAIATRNLINIMKTSRNGKITSVYNGLDLRYVSFYNCNLKNATFDNTKIYPYNFTPTGHTGYINSVAFSPDGTKIVSGGSDCTVRVWDIKTELQIGTPLIGHTGWVKSVAFSPDGTKIVSGSWDETIRIWDVETGRQLGNSLTGHTGEVESVAFSPDGTKIVSGSWDKTIRIWDAETGRQIGESLIKCSDEVRSVSFSPNGKQLASGCSDGTICIWDAETGRQIGKPLTGHVDAVYCVAFSPNGKKLVSGGCDGTIRIWDVETGLSLGTSFRVHDERVKSVAFSPDGQKIVSGSWDKTISIWDVETGRRRGNPLTGHSSAVNAVAFSPDGTKIVSGGWDETIRIWDAETGRQIGEPLTGPAATVRSVCFPPIGKMFAVRCDDGTIRIWDVETGRQVSEPFTGDTVAVISIAFSPDGTKIVSGGCDETIRIWDAETGRQIGEPLTGHTGMVESVAFSPDGTKIVSGSWDKTIRIWDAETGKQIGEPLTGHTGRVESVAFLPDGTKIVSGSWDKTIRIWDVETGRQIGNPLTGLTGWVESVAFSHDGTKIVGVGGNIIHIWDAETGRQIGEPLTGHTGTVKSVAFSPDDTKIVSGSWDKTIRIWDAGTGRQIGEPLTGHTSGVRSVAFSQDGTKIVSGSLDKTMRIWDLKKHVCSVIQIMPTCIWNCDFKNAQYNGDDPSDFYKIIYDNGGDVKQEYIPGPIPFEYNENQNAAEAKKKADGDQGNTFTVVNEYGEGEASCEIPFEYNENQNAAEAKKKADGDQDNTFIVVNDFGEDVQCEILFVYEDEETGVNYIAYTDNTMDEEGNTKVYASRFDPTKENPTLYPLESAEEWEKMEQLLASLSDDEDSEEPDSSENGN